MAWTYMLLCSDGTLYTGAAKNLQERLSKHQEGKGAKYTRGRRPVKLVWSEEQDSMSLALKREYEVKQLSRREKIKLTGMRGVPRGRESSP